MPSSSNDYTKFSNPINFNLWWLRLHYRFTQSATFFSTKDSYAMYTDTEHIFAARFVATKDMAWHDSLIRFYVRRLRLNGNIYNESKIKWNQMNIVDLNIHVSVAYPILCLMLGEKAGARAHTHTRHVRIPKKCKLCIDIHKAQINICHPLRSTTSSSQQGGARENSQGGVGNVVMDLFNMPHLSIEFGAFHSICIKYDFSIQSVIATLLYM